MLWLLLLVVEIARADEPAPPGVVDTGADTGAWFIRNYGLPGLVMWLVVQVRSFRPTLIVEHRLTPDAVRVVRKLVDQVTDHDGSDDSSTPGGVE